MVREGSKHVYDFCIFENDKEILKGVGMSGWNKGVALSDAKSDAATELQKYLAEREVPDVVEEDMIVMRKGK
jgi:hypothetical protein